MRRWAVILIGFFSLLPAGAFAADAGVVEQTKMNLAVLQCAKDADVFLFILNNIKSGNTDDVEHFLENQLDQIAVGLSRNSILYNDYQKRLARERLEKIRDYRLTHTRNQNGSVASSGVSEFLLDEEPGIGMEAEQVLNRMSRE